MQPNYKAVLLDIDGTLIDSNEQHADSWVEVFKEYGYDVPREEIRSLIGMGGDNLIKEVAGLDKDDSKSKAITEARGKLLKAKYLPVVQPFPGAHDLLQRFKDAKIVTVLATSSKQDETEILVDKLQAKDLVDEGATGSDAENSKPDPDIIIAALEKSKMQPGDVVMLGDAPYDIQAAAKAGVKVIALRSGGFSDHDLKGAIAIYNDPADLLAHFDAVFEK